MLYSFFFLFHFPATFCFLTVLLCRIKRSGLETWRWVLFADLLSDNNNNNNNNNNVTYIAHIRQCRKCGWCIATCTCVYACSYWGQWGRPVSSATASTGTVWRTTSTQYNSVWRRCCANTSSTFTSSRDSWRPHGRRWASTRLTVDRTLSTAETTWYV